MYDGNDSKKSFNIAIIGAGCAGLFTAMIFDHLKEEFGLDVEYHMLEANKEKRLGGRLFSHYFTGNTGDYPVGKHDYYEVGAMRFPEIKTMDRYSW